MLRLAYRSPRRRDGIPREASTSSSSTAEGADLRIDYEAATSAPTVVNLTNHTCWNLAGEGSGSVDGHVLTLHASAYTPVDASLLPTGEIRSVDATPLDFRAPTPIGARGGGYDHNLVVDRRDDSLELAAHVLEPASGRTLEVLTTEPGVAALHRHVPRRLARRLEWSPLPSGRLHRSRDPTLPGLAESSCVPVDRASTRRDVQSTTVFRFGRQTRARA